MPELRLFFEKAGPAKWLSHLDVMHTLSRAFLRGGVPLRHSEGFNPHPYLSIAHPLPVGVEGLREVLDVETERADLSAGEIADRINATLPEGLHVLSAGQPAEAAKKIAFAVYRLRFCYDGETPDGEALAEFFSRDPIPVMKRTKKGESEINLHAAYTAFRVEGAEPGCITAETVVDASQAPINPKYFEAALQNTPLAPSQLLAARVGFLNTEGKRFE